MTDTATKYGSRKEVKRVYWIDYGRGFVMWGTTIFWFLPRGLRENLSFIAEHAPSGIERLYSIHLYDVGALAYVFILGLVVPFSYKKAVEEDNNGFRRRASLRFCALVLLGILFDGARVRYLNSQLGSLPFLDWGIFHVLAVSYLTAVIGLNFDKNRRLLLSGGMLLLHQLCLSFWADYVWYIFESSRGGPLVSVFGFGAIAVYGSIVGEYVLYHQGQQRKLLIPSLKIAFLFFAVGAAYWLVGVDPARRFFTVSYAALSLAVCHFSISVFIWLEIKWKSESAILTPFGKNPLLVFVLLMIGGRAARELGTPDSVMLAIVSSLLLYGITYLLMKRGLSLRV